MFGRKSIIGLCLLCALAISGLAAQSAFAAEENGTTAFTCKNVGQGNGEFNKAHCKKGDTEVGGAYAHIAIANGTTTELSGSNATTPGSPSEPSILKTTVAGTEIVIEAAGVEGVEETIEGVHYPWMHNAEPSAGKHEATGKGRIRYTGVKVTNPAGCTLRESEGGTLEQVTTKMLKAHTGLTGVEGMALVFEPNEGTSFAKFFIEGAACPAIVKGNKEVFGTVVSNEIDGATTTFTEATTTANPSNLHYGALTGPRAGIGGLLTLTARANNTESFTPLSATTTCKHSC